DLFERVPHRCAWGATHLQLRDYPVDLLHIGVDIRAVIAANGDLEGGIANRRRDVPAEVTNSRARVRRTGHKLTLLRASRRLCHESRLARFAPRYEVVSTLSADRCALPLAVDEPPNDQRELAVDGQPLKSHRYRSDPTAVLAAGAGAFLRQFATPNYVPDRAR